MTRRQRSICWNIAELHITLSFEVLWTMCLISPLVIPPSQPSTVVPVSWSNQIKSNVPNRLQRVHFQCTLQVLPAIQFLLPQQATLGFGSTHSRKTCPVIYSTLLCFILEASCWVYLCLPFVHHMLQSSRKEIIWYCLGAEWRADKIQIHRIKSSKLQNK